jgi:hypothetical protein
VPPEDVCREGDGPRDGGDVVEPEEDAEEDDVGRAVNGRQEQQADAAEGAPDAGPPRPSSKRPSAPAMVTWLFVQPVSAWIGRRSAPGAARVPAPRRMIANAIATITQP